MPNGAWSRLTQLFTRRNTVLEAPAPPRTRTRRQRNLAKHKRRIAKESRRRNRAA